MRVVYQKNVNRYCDTHNYSIQNYRQPRHYLLFDFIIQHLFPLCLSKAVDLQEWVEGIFRE